MCGCEKHHDATAECTCICPEHRNFDAAYDLAMSRYDQIRQLRNRLREAEEELILTRAERDGFREWQARAENAEQIARLAEESEAGWRRDADEAHAALARVKALADEWFDGSSKAKTTWQCARELTRRPGSRLVSAAQKVEQVLGEHWEMAGSKFDGFQCDCGYGLGNGSGDLDGRHRAHVAEQIVAALGEPTVEYGVRWDVDGWDDERCDDRAHAESLIERWPNGGGVLVTRVITGEWQEADRGE